MGFILFYFFFLCVFHKANSPLIFNIRPAMSILVYHDFCWIIFRGFAFAAIHDDDRHEAMMNGYRYPC